MNNLTAEDITDRANSKPRHLELPLITIGYMGQLIIDIVQAKAKQVKSRPLTLRPNTIKPK